jgi:chromosome partitioning protein
MECDPEIRMYVITIAGPKGGCGKSTLTSSLAVRASFETGKVAMIDLDEAQGTLTEWWTLRGRVVNPLLYDGEGTLDEMVEALRSDGWTYTFIDGPPHEQDLIEMSVLVADVVLIPVKPAYFDMAVVDSIIAICKRRKKPFSFVINEFDDRKAFQNSNNIALAMIEGRGQVLNTRMSYHPKHRVGQVDGQTGAELDKSLSREIDAVWTDTKKLAGIGPAIKKVEGGRG